MSMTRLGSVKVREYMADKVVTVGPEMAIAHAIRMLVTFKYSGAPVVDEHGRVIGVLSEKDCLKVVIRGDVEGVDAALVGDYMATVVETVTPDTDLLDVARRFVKAQFKRFPVVDNGKLVGQISRSDVLRAIQDLI